MEVGPATVVTWRAFSLPSLNPPNCAMEHNEAGNTLGVDIALAISPLTSSLFLKLAVEIFVECDLELSGQLDFARLDHLDLNRSCLDSGWLVFVGRQRTGSEKRGRPRTGRCLRLEAVSLFSFLALGIIGGNSGPH